jgi:putative thioredoxin
MSDSPYVLSATAASFDRLVLENSRRGPVLVDFWAPWAGPSLRQAELLKRLAQEFGGRFLLVTVDTDREKGLAERFGVRSLPSCKLFRYGRVAEQVHGMQTESDYRALIERHAVALADRVQAAALEVWGQGDRDRAIRILAEGAMAEPERPELPLLMAKLLTQDGRADDAFAVLDALPSGLKSDPAIAKLHTHVGFVVEAQGAPPQAELDEALAAEPGRLDLRLKRAALRLVADDPDGALVDLAEIHRLDPAFRDGVGRRGLIAVLEQIAEASSPDDPRIGPYRRLLFQH